MILTVYILLSPLSSLLLSSPTLPFFLLSSSPLSLTPGLSLIFYPEFAAHALTVLDVGKYLYLYIHYSSLCIIKYLIRFSLLSLLFLPLPLPLSLFLILYTQKKGTPSTRQRRNQSHNPGRSTYRFARGYVGTFSFLFLFLFSLSLSFFLFLFSYLYFSF